MSATSEMRLLGSPRFMNWAERYVLKFVKLYSPSGNVMVVVPGCAALLVVKINLLLLKAGERFGLVFQIEADCMPTSQLTLPLGTLIALFRAMENLVPSADTF